MRWTRCDDPSGPGVRDIGGKPDPDLGTGLGSSRCSSAAADALDHGAGEEQPSPMPRPGALVVKNGSPTRASPRREIPPPRSRISDGQDVVLAAHAHHHRGARRRRILRVGDERAQRLADRARRHPQRRAGDARRRPRACTRGASRMPTSASSSSAPTGTRPRPRPRSPRPRHLLEDRAAAADLLADQPRIGRELRRDRRPARARAPWRRARPCRAASTARAPRPRPSSRATRAAPGAPRARAPRSARARARPARR